MKDGLKFWSMEMNKCKVCSHKNRNEIDKLILSGTSIRDIAGQFGLTKSSVQRHKKHLQRKLVKASEVKETITANSLFGQLRDLHSEALNILEEAKSRGNLQIALNAIGRVKELLELQAKLLGELQEGNVINIYTHPDWIELRNIILLTLEDYPEAKNALVERLNDNRT